MYEAIKKLVEILNYEEDPQYERILKPVLEDVSIESLEKVLHNRDKVIRELFDKSDAKRLSFPTFDKLIDQNLIEKINGGMRILEPFIVENGMESSAVKIGTKPVYFGKDVTVRRSNIDSQTYLDNGCTIQYSAFPENDGLSFVGPNSIVSESNIWRSVISGDEKGEKKKTYIHPLNLLNTLVGHGTQVSYPTVSFSHPLHDGNATFVNPLTFKTFDTKSRKNPSFIGSQRKFNGQTLRTKIGAGVILNNPCVVGSGYVVDNHTNFYGIAWLDEKDGSMVAKHIEPSYGLKSMPFLKS